MSGGGKGRNIINIFLRDKIGGAWILIRIRECRGRGFRKLSYIYHVSILRI